MQAYNGPVTGHKALFLSMASFFHSPFHISPTLNQSFS